MVSARLDHCKTYMFSYTKQTETGLETGLGPASRIGYSSRPAKKITRNICADSAEIVHLLGGGFPVGGDLSLPLPLPATATLAGLRKKSLEISAPTPPR